MPVLFFKNESSSTFKFLHFTAILVTVCSFSFGSLVSKSAANSCSPVLMLSGRPSGNFNKFRQVLAISERDCMKIPLVTANFLFTVSSGLVHTSSGTASRRSRPERLDRHCCQSSRTTREALFRHCAVKPDSTDTACSRRSSSCSSAVSSRHAAIFEMAGMSLVAAVLYNFYWKYTLEHNAQHASNGTFVAFVAYVRNETAQTTHHIHDHKLPHQHSIARARHLYLRAATALTSSASVHIKDGIARCMQDPPGGPAEDVRILEHGDAIYDRVRRQMPTFPDLDECQLAFQAAKLELLQTYRNLERARVFYAEPEGRTLASLRMLVHSNFGRLRTVRVPPLLDIAPADRIHYLVFPEVASVHMRTLSELYRDVQRETARCWRHPDAHGQTLKTRCLQVISKLHNICDQSRQFTAPTASALPAAREYFQDTANLHPQDEPRAPDDETRMMLGLLHKLKMSNL